MPCPSSSLLCFLRI
uniref:Uncharacterized protein n=1 Tax=Arundo donax TaxID=35708 RepID=A0A0A9FCZ1_ARUDO